MRVFIKGTWVVTAEGEKCVSYLPSLPWYSQLIQTCWFQGAITPLCIFVFGLFGFKLPNHKQPLLVNKSHMASQAWWICLYLSVVMYIFGAHGVNNTWKMAEYEHQSRMWSDLCSFCYAGFSEHERSAAYRMCTFILCPCNLTFWGRFLQLVSHP